MKPLILKYAVNRKEKHEIVYDYDFLESLNVIKNDNQKKIFIDSNEKELSLLTKTKVKNEKDDDNDIIELMTKTEVRPEQDDNWNPLLELKTKTYVKQERDDEDFNNLK